MRFSKLSVYLAKLEKTASRNSITEILADLFTIASEDEIDKIVYLLLGRLAPKYEGVVFNIAEQMMLSAVSTAYGVVPKKVKRVYKTTGDLGLVAESFSDKKGSELSVKEVFAKLTLIANDEGEGSQDRKITETAKLLSSLDSLSVRFVTRIPVGKLRLGFSDKTIIDALSWMTNGDKNLKGEIEKAYFVMPDVGRIALLMKKGGVKKLGSAKPVIGVPVLPMLAQRLKSPDEMVKKMGEVAIESKLDGLRIQIHFKRKGFKSGGKVRVYTRNLNNTSWMFPELEKMGASIKADEAILDTEAVGLDEETKKMANFQTTMTRRRKHDIEGVSQKVGIEFYVFDILLVDGKSFMDSNYLQRRELVERIVKTGKLFKVVDSFVTTNPQEIAKATKDKQEQGLEGIMVKKVVSGYVPGRTGWRWVKMKEQEDSVAKLVDNVDCVVMGYTRGKGKRAGFGVGQFLAGIRDRGKIKTITKVGTGITDEQFRELKKRLIKLEIKEKPINYVVPKDLEPDYWVEPELVVELAADEITVSPRHTSGYALRFPRLVKFRGDRSVGDVDNIKEIKELFGLQC